MSRALYLVCFSKEKKEISYTAWLHYNSGTKRDIESLLWPERNIKWSSDRPEQTGNLDNTNTPDISIKVNFNSLDY